VATSPAFPTRPIGHTDAQDRANHRFFAKKNLLLIQNQPGVPSRPAPAPAPPPRLEKLPPPRHRAACRGPAPRHGLARAPAMAAGQEEEGGGGRAKSGRDRARRGRRHHPSRTSRPTDPAAAATGRARGCRIWPAPPRRRPPSPPLWEGTAGGSRRGGRSTGRRSSAATLERGAALPEDHGEEAEVAMESLSPWRARASAGRRGPHRRRVCGVVQLHPGRATRQEQLRAWLWLLAGVGVAVPVRLLPEAGVVATAWHAARLLALLFDWRGEGKKK